MIGKAGNSCGIGISFLGAEQGIVVDCRMGNSYRVVDCRMGNSCRVAINRCILDV